MSGLMQNQCVYMSLWLFLLRNQLKSTKHLSIKTYDLLEKVIEGQIKPTSRY